MILDGTQIFKLKFFDEWEEKRLDFWKIFFHWKLFCGHADGLQPAGRAMAGGLLLAGTDAHEEIGAQQRHLQYGTSAAQGFDMGGWWLQQPT